LTSALSWLQKVRDVTTVKVKGISAASKALGAIGESEDAAEAAVAVAVAEPDARSGGRRKSGQPRSDARKSRSVCESDLRDLITVGESLPIAFHDELQLIRDVKQAFVRNFNCH